MWTQTGGWKAVEQSIGYHLLRGGSPPSDKLVYKHHYCNSSNKSDPPGIKRALLEDMPIWFADSPSYKPL